MSNGRSDRPAYSGEISGLRVKGYEALSQEDAFDPNAPVAGSGHDAGDIRARTGIDGAIRALLNRIERGFNALGGRATGSARSDGIPGSKPRPLTHPKYRPDIDGLRAIAVLAVILFHAFPNWIGGGFIGVDVFFVISGYLISTILIDNLAKNTFSVSEFYARRIKRIFPALIIVLAFCFVLGWFVLSPLEYKQLGKHIFASAIFIQNIILWNETGYFDNAANTKPLLHIWSLGVEEQFYMAWPLILWVAWKYKIKIVYVIAFAILLSFMVNLLLVRSHELAVFYLPITRFWELAIGGLASLIASKTLYGFWSRENAQSAPKWLFRRYPGRFNVEYIANILSTVGFSNSILRPSLY